MKNKLFCNFVCKTRTILLEQYYNEEVSELYEFAKNIDRNVIPTDDIYLRICDSLEEYRGENESF